MSVSKRYFALAVLSVVALALAASAQPVPETSVKAQDFVSARVIGQVTDAAGRPIMGATVFMNRMSGARLEGRISPVTTDGEGRYELNVRFARGKTLTVHEVFAEAPGHVRAAPPIQMRLNGGETENLSFLLEKGEAFAGVVRVPLSDLERLSRRREEEIQRVLEVSGPGLDRLPMNARSILTQPGGRFEFWVPPGEYVVRMHGYESAPVEWTGLKSGRKDLVLDLPEFEWSEANVGKAFDGLWEVMDRHYSYFSLKPHVDWKASREQYRPKAVQAKNAKELVAALQEMLAPLRDLHIRIESPAGTAPTCRNPWTYNGNFQVTLARLADRTDCGKFATVGRTKGDSFGCFLMNHQTEANPSDVQKAVEAIKALRDTPGFLVDLRRANGGSEPLALEIAKLFCAKETTYARSKYRNGPAHDDFGAEHERLLPASPEPYTKPLICLIGPGAVSSGEGFVKMLKCLPNVTTVGLRTRGASGNPKPWPLPRTRVTVHFSRWVDLMPDSRTFEGVGIPPDVEVNEPAAAYRERDPTWETGIELLRRKVATAKVKE